MADESRVSPRWTRGRPSPEFTKDHGAVLEDFRASPYTKRRIPL